MGGLIDWSLDFNPGCTDTLQVETNASHHRRRHATEHTSIVYATNEVKHEDQLASPNAWQRIHIGQMASDNSE